MIWPLLESTMLTSPICQRLVTALAHFVWQGAMIAAVLAAILALFRPRSPATRYGLALAALALMAASPLLTFQRHGSTSALSHAAETTTDGIIPANAINDSTWTGMFEAAQPALLLAWLTGVSLLGLRLMCGAAATWWFRRGRQPIAYELERRLMRLGHKLGVRTVGRVFASSKVQVATAVGFLRPIVLLPLAWLAELPPAAIEAIVAHELAHIRRWDLWATLLQRVVETLLFYHPAVWWVSRLVEQERELCCDELAVAATGERLIYARTLAAVARAPLAPAALAVSITGERKMQLLNRVRHVLGAGATPARARWWPLGLLMASLPVVMWLMAAGIPSGTRALGDPPREGEARERGDRERGDRESPEARRDRDESKDREGDSDRPAGEKKDRAKQKEPPKSKVTRIDNTREAQLVKKMKTLEAELKRLEAELSKLRGEARDGEAADTDGELKIESGPLKLGTLKLGGSVKVETSVKRGPRDGDQPRKGPKDGDGSAKKRPPEGDSPREQPRDG